MKCDELKAYKGDVTIPVYGTIADADVYLKDKVDEAIEELKDGRELDVKTIEALKEENKRIKLSAEQILRDLLDCGLIKEWYFNGKFNAVLKADDPHLQISELKKKLEDVQASMYADVVDANMENRILRRELWLARTLRARDIQRWWIAATCAPKTERACSVWNNVERKCRAKAEEYK